MSRRPVHCIFFLLLPLIGMLGMACASETGRHRIDAESTADRGELNDLSTDEDAASSSEAFDVDIDREIGLDVDARTDAGSDVSADRSDVSDAAVDARADVTYVDLGGFLIPVDPYAVPAPGSECTSGAGAPGGDPVIEPPRPIRPLSVSRVTSQRPTFQWVLPEGITGAHVEVCADRCCARVLQTIDAEGTTVRPMTPLPPGVVFWRMFGKRGTTVGTRASYTWEFEVRRRDAPNDTSWGTIRDFNGDGFDDLVMFRVRVLGAAPADLLMISGSPEGLQAPMATGVVAGRVPYGAELGDFNGDGLADLAWTDWSGPIGRTHSWFEIVAGSRDGMHSVVHPDFSPLGACARTTSSAVVDWNGDGYSDLIAGVLLGCNSSIPVEASILLGYMGSATGIATMPQWALRVDGWFAHRLVSITSGFGDLDNDGHGDVFIVSASSGFGTSSVPAEHAILHGGMGREPRIDRLPQPPVIRGSWRAARPESAGDVDGDGYLDLLLSLNDSSPLYIYRGGSALVDPSSSLMDPVGGSNFGLWSSIGDLNGDGLSDVIVSSELAHALVIDGFPANMGRVYVFPGSAGGVVSEPVWVERARPHMEEVIMAFFGTNPVSPGDINGDGVDDVIMSDTFGRRLCARYGRVGFATGTPDICLDGVGSSETLAY